MMLIF